MSALPLGVAAYERTYGRTPTIRLRNRFMERAPTNMQEQTMLLSRPPTTFFATVGSGPIRGNFSLSGLFNSDLFTASGAQLIRTAADGSQITISGSLAQDGTIEFAPMFGPGYEYLFVADGTNLQYYPGESFATATLTLTPGAIVNDVVEVNGVYYQFAADPTAGAPNGSSGSPFLVDVGVDDAASLENLSLAINAAGTPGVTYSAEIEDPHPTVEAREWDALTMTVRARTRGTGGNSYTVDVTGDDGLAWDDSTLSGGGVHALFGVETPDNVGIVSVDAMAGFVIAVGAQSQRAYFIFPGETTIEPLDFAEAEAQPDQIVNVKSVGDVVWFLGVATIEPWYATGDEAAPFQPIKGRAISQGVVEGTAVRIGNQLAFVGAGDNKVYLVSGDLNRISNHGIEELVRRARKIERDAALEA